VSDKFSRNLAYGIRDVMYLPRGDRHHEDQQQNWCGCKDREPVSRQQPVGVWRSGNDWRVRAGSGDDDNRTGATTTANTGDDADNDDKDVVATAIGQRSGSYRPARWRTRGQRLHG